MTTAANQEKTALYYLIVVNRSYLFSNISFFTYFNELVNYFLVYYFFYSLIT